MVYSTCFNYFNYYSQLRKLGNNLTNRQDIADKELKEIIGNVGVFHKVIPNYIDILYDNLVANNLSPHYVVSFVNLFVDKGFEHILKKHAKHDIYGFISFLEKFDVSKIKDQSIFVEIAKDIDMRRLGETYINILIKYLSQNILVEIIKVYAKEFTENCVSFFSYYCIQSETARIEIAKICAENDGRKCAEFIKDFRIESETARIEIAKICAENDGRKCAEFIKDFRIESETARIEIAKLCAKQNGKGCSCFIENFGIVSENTRIEIAKLCIEQNNEAVYFIKNFGIKSEAERAEIAKLCAKQDGLICALLFENFQIESEPFRIEIARLCIKQNGACAQFIGKFQIQSEPVRIELAKLCAQQNGEKCARWIQCFEIHCEPARIEIAKLCAEQDSMGCAMYIRNFEIASESARIEILKICVEQPNPLWVTFIENFDIEADELTWIGIAKRFAKQNGGACAKYIANFRIRSKPALIEIIKICAKQDGKGCAESLRYFGQIGLSLEEIQEIFLLCMRQNFEAFRYYSGNFNEIFNLYAESMYLPRSNIEEGFKTLIERDFKECGFEWIISMFSQIKEEEVWRKVASSLVAFLFLLDKLMDREQIKQMNREGFMRSIYEIRMPYLHRYFFDQLLELYRNNLKGGNIAPLKLESYRKYYNLLRLLLISLEQKGIDVKSTENLINEKYKFFKDEKKFKLIVNFLVKLNDTDLISLEQKQFILNRLNVSDLFVLSTIFDLEEEKALCDPLCPFSQIVLEGVQKRMPIGGIDHFSEKFSQTFGSSRNPHAIWQYIAKMQQTRDPKVMECLASYITAVLEGTFLQERYRTENNPHLKQIPSDTLLLWQQDIRRPLGAVKDNEPSLFESLKWLKTKLLQDRHMAISDFLKEYLQESSPEAREKLLSEIEERITPFDKACVELSTKKTTKEQIASLKQLQSLAQGELLNDIKGQLQLMTSATQAGEYHLIETDDPHHLLLCGTEVAGSCQRIDGNPELNKGLLGYLLHGQTRLVAVINQKGQIVARNLLRLLWDGEKPVLFLDRFYGDPAYEPALKELAKEKAKLLGFALTSLEQGMKSYPKPLLSLGGPAPFEYCDGIGGMSNGKFTMEKVGIIDDSKKNPFPYFGIKNFFLN